MSRSTCSAGLAIVATLITAAAKFPAPGDACSLLTKEDAAAVLAVLLVTLIAPRVAWLSPGRASILRVW